MIILKLAEKLLGQINLCSLTSENSFWDNKNMFILRAIYYFLMDTLQTILIALAVFLVIYVLLFRPFQVNGQSMYPNFHNEQYILTNLIGYQEVFGMKFKTGHPKRGDVIVFDAPTNKEKDYIKRVIGLPGDTVSINNGDVYLNAKKFDESAYLKPEVKTYGQNFLYEGQSIVVPKGEYFVMGDNRPFSADSRDFGFVNKDAIVGLSYFIYWPIPDMKMIKNPFE